MTGHKQLTVVVDMWDKQDNFHEEDVAKNCLPFLTPFLTRRHGVDRGSMNLNDGAIVISWEYRDFYEDGIFEAENYE